MKIFSFPFQSDDFYCKPDTALAKPKDDFFLPPVCSFIRYAPCFVVKVDRLGRSIAARFASRYYSEVNLGVCIYGYPEKEEVSGKLWAPGTLLDYSLPMPRTFFTPDTLPPLVAVPSQEDLGRKLERLSSFVYLKMGDLMLLETAAPASIERGGRILLGDLIDVVIR